MRILTTATIMLMACTPSFQGGEPSNGVRLGATPTAAGDTIVLTLLNGSAGDVGYNLCTSALERRTADTWEPVPTDRVCTMELRLLPPGERATFPLTLPPGAPAGDYSFTTRVEDMAAGTARTVRSNTIRVRS
jgi:hypothetical protein